MMKRYRLLLALGLICSLAFVGCKKYAPKTGGVAVIACDETMENIIQQEIEVFENQYPQQSILPYYISEEECIDSLLHGHVQAAVITRALTPEEVSYLKGQKRKPFQQQIAVDAIALIVNPANPVENLSVGDLREILSGEVTNWDKVVPGGEGDIKVVFDNQGSSTASYMRNTVLGGKEFGANVYAQKTNADVFDYVKAEKGAIGVVGVAWLTNDLKHPKLDIKERVEMLQRNDTTLLETTADDFIDGVKILPVRSDDSLVAYSPYQQYICEGSYPLHRTIYMVSLGVPGSTAHQLYSFVTGKMGQKLILTTGILPARLKRWDVWDTDPGGSNK